MSTIFAGDTLGSPERPKLPALLGYIGLTIFRGVVTTISGVNNLDNSNWMVIVSLLLGIGALIAVIPIVLRKRLGFQLAMAVWIIDLILGTIALCSLGASLGAVLSYPIVLLPFAIDILLVYASYHYLNEEPARSYFN